MGWEKHDIIVMPNDGKQKTKEFKNVRLYRDRFGNLKDYVKRVI